MFIWVEMTEQVNCKREPSTQRQTEHFLRERQVARFLWEFKPDYTFSVSYTRAPPFSTQVPLPLGVNTKGRLKHLYHRKNIIYFITHSNENKEKYRWFCL